jgi:hypothetical protein
VAQPERYRRDDGCRDDNRSKDGPRAVQPIPPENLELKS